MPITCPKCQFVNKDSARFCSRCGTSFVATARMAGSSLTGMLSAQSILANRYQIVRKIGQGGMSAIYLVSDLQQSGQLYAVKEMSDAGITDARERRQSVAAFHQLAQVFARIQHPNIPRVITSFPQTGKNYMVMEYVPGDTLEGLLAQQNYVPFLESQVRQWTMQLCSVLQFLHSQNPPVIFRDLKPDNIMLTPAGQIKLIDFGIARFFSADKTSDTSALGTAGYAPPEQYGKGQTDVRSDVYALGATLYRLLTGYDPATSPFNLPPIKQRNPTLSAPMVYVITRALETEPTRRWSSVTEIQAYLDSQGVPIRTGPTGTSGGTGTSRPTTRLLMKMQAMTPAQLVLILGATLFVAIIATWVLTPFVSTQMPWLWSSFPLFMIVGPMAYAAARRPGAALLAHVPIVMAIWLTIQARIPIPSWSPNVLFWATVLSGLALELVLYVAYQLAKAGVQAPADNSDKKWALELGGCVLAAALANAAFEVIFRGDIAPPELWLGAAIVGALSWFAGDLIQQYLVQRKAGLFRH